LLGSKKKILFLLQCSKKWFTHEIKEKCRACQTDHRRLAEDLAGKHVAKNCAIVAKLDIGEDIDGELASELTRDLAGDPVANIFYNYSKTVKIL
jgi:hypothetical protein